MLNSIESFTEIGVHYINLVDELVRRWHQFAAEIRFNFFLFSRAAFMMMKVMDSFEAMEKLAVGLAVASQ